jgi:hypothetical protein
MIDRDCSELRKEPTEPPSCWHKQASLWRKITRHPRKRPQPDARPVGEPKPPAFRLLLGDLQPLTLPDPLDARIADQPAGIPQQRSDLAVAIAAVLPGQFDYVGRQPFRILSAPRDLTLRRAMLPERRTSAALGDMQMISDMLNAGSATRRGLEVSPGSLLKYELIKRQIGNSPALGAIDST